MALCQCCPAIKYKSKQELAIAARKFVCDWPACCDLGLIHHLRRHGANEWWLPATHHPTRQKMQLLEADNAPFQKQGGYEVTE